MSLGFNPNRKHRSSTLPGAIAAMGVLPRTRPAAVRRTSPVKLVVPAPVPVPVPVPVAAPPPLETSHWVYATAVVPLIDRLTSEALCEAGARVLLVYPMESDAETGRVRMRLKHAHPRTGQLAQAWVDVYDPDADVRTVTDFAMVP